MNNLGIMLKKLREDKGYTIKQLAEKAGVSNGTVGDIETGRNKSTIKTIEKLAKALGLNKNERELLFSAFMPVDIGKKLSKRERVQFDDVLNSASHFFNDENVSEDDKLKMRDSLLEAFYDAKAKNKRTK